jgi:hypothetical protein
MAGELGLRSTLRARIYEPLQIFRSGGRDGGGKEISLIDFIKTRAINEDGKAVGLKNTAGNPMEMDDLWCDLGLDPSALTLDNLLTMTDDMRYIAPEIVREFILQGFNMDASHLDLVAGVESVDNMTVTSPWVKVLDEAPVSTGEVETIAEADLEWGEKSVKIRKMAKAFKASDELLLQVRLPILSYFLRRFGVALSVALYNLGVTTLMNGDQADGSDSIAELGCTTGGAIDFPDFLRAWIRARRIAMNWRSMVTSETTAFSVMQIDEFATPVAYGPAIVNVESRNRIIPANMSHQLSAQVTDGHAMLFDQQQAMIGLMFRPLLVENERIIMRQLNGTACSIIFGYLTLLRFARILLGTSQWVAGTGTDFPSWMAPLV